MSAACYGQAPSVETRGEMDRRTRRTNRALRRAFASLVLEKGYEHIGVEDITERADVARATFYAHFADKEALFIDTFQDLLGEMVARLSEVPIEPGAINTGFFCELFRHAEEQPDLYQACFSASGAAWGSYLTTVAEAAEFRFTRRYELAGTLCRVPMRFNALGFAGMHTALLADWLIRGRPESVDEMAIIETQLLSPGV